MHASRNSNFYIVSHVFFDNAFCFTACCIIWFCHVLRIFYTKIRWLIQHIPMKSAKFYHWKSRKRTQVFSPYTPGWEYENHWEPTSPTACRFRAALQLHRQQLRHGAAQPRLGGGIPGGPWVAHGKPMQLGCFGPTKHKHVKKIQKGSWRRTVLKSVEGTNPNIQNCDHNNKDDDGTSNDTNDYVLIY